MKSNNKLCRLFSIMLASVLLFLSLDLSASAETVVTYTVTSFLDFKVGQTEFDVGTSDGEIASRLPSALGAKAEKYTVEEGSASSSGGVATGPATSMEYDVDVSVPVTWVCSNFDSEEPGVYTFKAQTTDSTKYIVGNSIYPTINVQLTEPIPVEVPEEKENPAVEEPEVNTPEQPAPEGKPEETPVEEPEETTPEQQEKPTPAPAAEQPSGSSNNGSNNTSSGSSNNGSNNTSNGSSNNSSNSTNPATETPATETPATSATPAQTTTPAAESSTQQTASTNTGHSSSSSSSHSAFATPKVEEQTTEASIVVEQTPAPEKEESTDDIPVAVTSKTETKSEISVGKGKAVINIQNDNSSEVTATITDDETLLKNILTEEQLKRVAEGATVNLKISANIVKASDLSAEDSDSIQKGVEEYKKDKPGLNIAGYLDISIYLQMDDEDWSYVSNTNKPVELVVTVPESMRGLSDNYYLLRLHDGQTTLFSDNDDDPNTITVSTGKFSIYVVMYDSEAAAEIEKTEKKELNLLIIFVIALIVVLVIQIVYIFAIRKKLHSVGQ
ncbi:hypothetical protein SAMN04487829_2212 [Pseudobutyrivibrio sp. NOR37]|uniref:Uncharacterized protein n=1 Tax=Pseudobutyrivibrio xylanivorans TaxID=185007 RepID=A0A6M0LLB2_PSEXY|nr:MULTISPECIES: hypothetical protein [Pseudobutyrivibrio]NEX02749.1 hypothetical protein [Pseudobutyrivibrio xylanivorans]SFR80816.1 hypothetical protein SAMN04487829_2212 [Pseudobutyrivibrio sp. NOR37]